MEALLAEDLLLIALDGDGSTRTVNVDPGLAGALLIDLARSGALHTEDKKIVPAEGITPAHPLLARTHAVIAASGKLRTIASWLDRLPRELKPLCASVAAGLVERGVLQRQRHRFLGFFSRERFPAADPRPADDRRARLHGVLNGDDMAQEGDGNLLALVVALELVGQLVAHAELPRARARAQQIANETAAASSATRTVQQEVVAAIARHAAWVSRAAGFS